MRRVLKGIIPPSQKSPARCADPPSLGGALQREATGAPNASGRATGAPNASRLHKARRPSRTSSGACCPAKINRAPYARKGMRGPTSVPKLSKAATARATAKTEAIANDGAADESINEKRREPMRATAKPKRQQTTAQPTRAAMPTARADESDGESRSNSRRRRSRREQNSNGKPMRATAKAEATVDDGAADASSNDNGESR